MEELPPNIIAPLIEKRLADLQKILAAKRKSYEKAPQGRIRISQNGGHPEYYLITERGSLRGKYLPHSQETLARQLAQKDYDARLIKQLQKRNLHTAKLPESDWRWVRHFQTLRFTLSGPPRPHYTSDSHRQSVRGQLAGGFMVRPALRARCTLHLYCPWRTGALKIRSNNRRHTFPPQHTLSLRVPDYTEANQL